MKFIPLILCLGWAVGLTIAAAQPDLSHRQSAIKVEVRNASAVPLRGAIVEVEMVNHDFRFGAAFSDRELDVNDAIYSERALEVVQEYFNSVTFGNFLKWTYTENRPAAATQSVIDEVIAMKPFGYAAEPFMVRGHTTVWGAEYQLPLDLRATADAAEAKARIRNHVTDYHAQLKDSGIEIFDLYNEPFHERELVIEKALPGASLAEEAIEVAEWFKLAQAADPDAVLYINEYNMLNFWQEHDSDVIAYKSFVDAIRDAGGPVGGIGLQAHMDRFITKEQIVRRLNILAAPMAPTANHPDGLPGLPLEVTELDINTLGWTTATPEQQAEVVANVLDGAFEHPSVEGITFWGMRDSIHWRGNSPMFDDSDPGNWVLKPSGAEWVNRIKGSWWTDIAGLSDDDGLFQGTVFKGTHRIRVTYDGVVQEHIRNVVGDETVAVEFNADPIDTSNSRLSNLSVRTQLAADQRLTIGFVVSGGAKELLVRAAGPALNRFGLAGMPDPLIEVYNQASELAGSNDNWTPSLASVFSPLGAFAWVAGSLDAALVQSMTGPTTAQTVGATGGVVLVEAYDTAPNADGSRLVNLSARNTVGAGADIMIAGFAIAGTGHKRLLIRAVGPQLNTSFGVPGVLMNPKLEIFNAANQLIGSNDDWSDALTGAFDEVGAFPLDSGSRDAATLVVLAAGTTYTVAVLGADGGTGVALVEIYELE